MEVSDMTIRIQYDGYNRCFKILDRAMAPLLEDGDVYLLVVSDSEDDPEISWADLPPVTLGHA
jgi:hypothetical protein